MKNRLTCVAMFAVAAMLLVGITGSALAAAPGTPFKGTLEASEIYNFDFSTMTMYVDANGSGNATHLGKYTVTYEAVVNLNVGSSDGDAIHFVAANGDTLEAVGFGHGGPSGIPDVNSVIEVFTITGGTGRFLGATGSLTLERLVSTVTGITSGTFDGTIVVAQGK